MARRRLLASIAVEFALVVVGVLVALWVNDWHQARQDRETAVGPLARMEAELFADAFDLAVAEQRARARLWMLDGVLARLSDRSAESRLTPARADSIVYPLGWIPWRSEDWAGQWCLTRCPQIHWHWLAAQLRRGAPVGPFSFLAQYAAAYRCRDSSKRGV